MGLFDKKDKKDVLKIGEDDLNDAKLSSLDFSDVAVKKRAFMNVLGARLAMKSLFSKKIQANNIYSLYTIHSVLGEIDIADIYFEGIKIDVRLVFDRNEIFIPKSHFEYDLLPDFYLVMELQENFSGAEPLGFFEPQAIDKSLANQNFYFFEFENLTDVKELKATLNKFKKEATSEISDQDMEKAQELILSLVDKEISKTDKLILFKQLAQSFSLREKMVELENFEIISKEAPKYDDLLKDGILNIVGTQQLYENEPIEDVSLEDAFAEFAELTGEEAEDSFTDEDLDNVFEEISESEPEPEPENEPERDSDNKPSGDFASGLAIGATVAGAAAAGAMAAGAMTAGTTAAAQSVSAVGNAVEVGAQALSAGIELVEDIMDSAVKNNNDDNDDELLDFNDLDELAASTEISQEEAGVEAEEIDELEDIMSSAEEMLAEEEEETEEIEIVSEEEEPEEIEEFIETDVLEELEEVEEDENSDLPEVEDLVEAEIKEEEEDEEEETEELGYLDNLDEIEDLQPLEELEEIVDETEEEPEEEELEEEIEEEEEEVIEEESKEESQSESEVFNVDDFDFDILSGNDEPSNAESTEELMSFDSITVKEEIPEKTSNASESQTSSEIDKEEETLRKIKELEEMEELEENKEPEDKPEAEVDQAEDFISQVDEFLNDIESSDEQKQLLESTLASENIDDLIKLTDEEQASVQEEAKPKSESISDDPLQVLFTEEQAKLSPESAIAAEIKSENSDADDTEFEEGGSVLDKDKIMELFSKNKKMVITASVAGLVLASFTVGANMIKKNQQTALQNNNTPNPVTAEGQAPGDLMQESGLGPDVQGDAQDQGLDAIGNQDIPSENTQANPNKDMGKAVSDAFLSEPVNANISKVAWEVPEDLAYNDSFRKYLQMAGKNLKLNLQNDLLLTNEMAYSNKVVVDMTINGVGNLQSSNIAASSGSKQIDKIVLQSVKDTLKYLKMPSSELSGGSADITLIINF